ncbi:histidine phosphatase family protein [Ktedonospora formicarum]|uniref:Histidine phosphatase family protein n=1 Tax=Ktedonospora formicarum TaxID=2778364 RepID=A0A8J3IA29_9CHLR|nr:histidine phosphatase family protein [Ktedonospora formicarum]GHO48274.1 hypothetical protein KSX_64370 [Ktedonospora formicarum]
MLTLFYSPHMTSVDNEAGHASGHANVPLSQAGWASALELGQHYAQEDLDAVFCSDLLRATATAERAFAGRDIPIIPDKRLRECDYGKLTQHPVIEIDKEFPRRIHTPFPGGQSVEMVVRGVGAFLREAIRIYDGKSIVVIGHRATKYALAYWHTSNSTLKEIVNTPWEWRDIPIWRYEFQPEHLERAE